MRRRVIIVSGGEVADSDLHIITKDDVVLSCDGGVIPLINKGIYPHLAVGDFDTLTENELKKINEIGISTKKLSIHKEETDTHYAIKIAREYQPQEVVLLGALGGPRFDHMLGNVGLLEWLSDIGQRAVILHQKNRIRLLKGPATWTLKRDTFSYISFIPVTKKVSGVTTEGLLYPLCNETLCRGQTLGLSNELQKEKASISIKKGKCLVIESID